MGISWVSLTTILGMLVITYSTRLAGFFLLKNRQFSPKMARVMESAPACVLLSVIAPHFVSDKPYDCVSGNIVGGVAIQYDAYCVDCGG